MGWAGHMACMGTKEIYVRIWQGNKKEISHLEDLDTDGISKKWGGISKNWDGKMWTLLIWLRVGSNGGLL